MRSHNCVVGDSEALLVCVRRWVTIYENLNILSSFVDIPYGSFEGRKEMDFEDSGRLNRK